VWTLHAIYWKTAIIVVASLVIDIGLHFLWAPTPTYAYPLSYFVISGWFLPIVIALLLTTYIALALIFQFIQAKLPGTKFVKGLTFGIAFGGLMLISSPAMSLLFGSSMIAELRIGLVDGCVICLLGVLLGWFTATNGSPRQRPMFAPVVISMAVVGLVYFLLHFLIYLALPSLFPAYITQPTETMLWILMVGLWIGLMNWLLQDAFSTGSFVRQAIGFTGIAFGIFSLLNTLFAPIFVAAPTAILLLNTGAGILFVGVGVWTERVARQQLSHVGKREVGH
jgi:hypothetical protein